MTDRFHRRRAHILFERLLQEKSEQHGVAKGSVENYQSERWLSPVGV
jgi:hypothetical protein